ncbi:tetratricopeptide repeat protein [Flavobacterium soyangense]|uniref:Tetratricopeptide repeat protein n=1 Tax=Flavobacterium soyangense TaxID=2023265 RepID=A0A930Y128_9FLAO|nr:hypothetical protein [Flavobacterium soyangense]MBF2709024.1 hypothetical protein [Flavobacterium soyangense]
MNWFSNLFKKKTKNNTSNDNSDSEWDAFISFARGEKYFFNSEWNDALYHFDKAIEKDYKKDDIFELRGMCLQALGYDYDAIEDFNKAIIFSPNNCNLYYNRALSKEVILDYEGEIKDIEKAIELSKQDTQMNRQYNKEAIDSGFRNGVVGLYEIGILRVKSRLEFDNREMNKDYCEEQLKLIKRR